MTAHVILALRLAGISSAPNLRSARLRSATVLAATALGVVVLLSIAAVIASEVRARPMGLEKGHVMFLVGVVLMVALPVLALAMTAARLTSSVRDRRLASLLLLGLTRRDTRLILFVETGVSAIPGGLLGAASFLALRPLLAAMHPAGRHWHLETLRLPWWVWCICTAGVCVVVMGVAMFSSHPAGTDIVEVAKQMERQRPRLLRAVPLMLGLALSSFVLARQHQLAGGPQDAPYMVLALFLMGLGLLVATPLLVQALARLLVARSARPTGLLAGRRLEAQAVATTRVIGGLLVAIYVVIGARVVIGDFENNAYQAVANRRTVGELGIAIEPASGATPVLNGLAAHPAIQHVAGFPMLRAGCRDSGDYCVTAFVASCAQIRTFYPDITGCSDAQPSWLDMQETDQALSWSPRNDRDDGVADALKTLPIQNVAETGWSSPITLAYAVIPPRLAGDVPGLADADVAVFVQAKANIGLAGILGEVGATHALLPDYAYYDFVRGMRYMSWAVMVLSLSLGLISLTLSSLDRANARRSELNAIQLLGVSAGSLRRAQFIEVSLPLLAGVLLACGLGVLAGNTFLSYARLGGRFPWSEVALLGGIGLSAALTGGLAALIATVPKIKPDEIRTS